MWIFLVYFIEESAEGDLKRSIFLWTVLQYTCALFPFLAPMINLFSFQTKFFSIGSMETVKGSPHDSEHGRICIPGQSPDHVLSLVKLCCKEYHITGVRARETVLQKTKAGLPPKWNTQAQELWDAPCSLWAMCKVPLETLGQTEREDFYTSYNIYSCFCRVSAC